MTHICVSFDFEKRLKCKFCNDDFHECQRDIIFAMLQNIIRQTIVRDDANVVNRDLIVRINKFNYIFTLHD